MGRLKELNLKTIYRKGHDDIARDFYIPCMDCATAYDRAVAYFRSSILIISWPALRAFAARGGHLRIVCSHELSQDDIEALDAGYSARLDMKLAEAFRNEVSMMLADDALRKPTRILAALVSDGVVDLKVALLNPARRETAAARGFHDKLGIFRDEEGDVVIFKGSMNESWNGIAADGNLESIDVSANWFGGRDEDRTTHETSYFEELWEDRYPTLRVRSFPEVARKELVLAADHDWEASVDQLVGVSQESVNQQEGGVTLRPHQAEALANWFAAGRRGIVAFVTGSGKTLTAISAIRNALVERKEPVLVVVPDNLLFRQWLKILRDAFDGIGASILRAGAGHSGWRGDLAAWSRKGTKPRIILSTVQTASSVDFLAGLQGGAHLFLVADEVHRLGSLVHQRLLDDALFGSRLGLSATPERAGDPVGTRRLLDYFEGILSPRYSLADAVRDGVLTPYFYRVHTVELTEEEAAEWSERTDEIARLYARIRNEDKTPSLDSRLQRLLLRRADIVKQAESKVPLAATVVKDNFEQGQKWIVYCDDLKQLQAVCAELSKEGIENISYHSQMEGDRAKTLKWFDRRGGVVVAIKCLDEGVDIPDVTHALILASSKNPREFIQRRGRVLRKAPEKALAHVHDAFVLPPMDTTGAPDERLDRITRGELARAIEFARHAANAAAASDLMQITIDAGLDWSELTMEGVEDEDQ